MIYGLPTELEVNGRYEPIRWEYTAVLDIIAAMNDPDLEDEEKAYTSLWILFENFEHFRNNDYDPAFEGRNQSMLENHLKIIDLQDSLIRQKLF